MDDTLNFFAREIDFELENSQDVRRWLAYILSANKREVDCINYIFCSDPYLKDLNKEHLDHGLDVCAATH